MERKFRDYNGICRNLISVVSMINKFLLVSVMLVLTTLSEADSWKKPGCHRIGLTRKINIPDCVEFSVTLNACRGYCSSWSIPSTWQTILSNPEQKITSVGQCCNIMDSEDVPVSVMCVDGVKELQFKSALSCSCYHCKRLQES